MLNEVKHLAELGPPPQILRRRLRMTFFSVLLGHYTGLDNPKLLLDGGQLGNLNPHYHCHNLIHQCFSPLPDRISV